jgi:hypothetical protein
MVTMMESEIDLLGDLHKTLINRNTLVCVLWIDLSRCKRLQVRQVEDAYSVTSSGCLRGYTKTQDFTRLPAAELASGCCASVATHEVAAKQHASA